MTMPMKTHILLAILVFALVSSSKAATRSFSPDSQVSTSTARNGHPPSNDDDHVYVHIINKVEDHAVIAVHCKSKDNDLGLHYLNYEETYQFKFRVNFWGTTLFFCGFHWHDKQVIGDAYDYSRDWDRCPVNCDWIVDQEAVYGVNKKGVYDVVYHWEQGKKKE
ncbi:hypothetical protein Droror1_Dr00023127 [Drosera rotundifolia]